MKNFSRRQLISSTAMVGAAWATQSASADVHGTQASADSMVLAGFARSVREFGATGNGKSDATTSFQKALDAAHSSGGGIVLVPAGLYRLDGSLIVPPGTTLQGVFTGPTSHPGRAVQPPSGAATPGSTLLATGGHGQEDGPALITMSDNAAVRGLSIHYPKQNSDATPVPYPWTIHMHGNNATVENVELRNAWRGIQAIQAHRHLIRNVTGQPLRTGVYVDEIYDIGRIENVHFNPWWSNSRPVLEFTYRHGESFVVGRSDWQYMLNTFSFGYHIGYRFIEGKTGSCNGNFLGLGADATFHACKIEQSQAPGLLFTNGEFVSFDYLNLGNLKPTQITVAPGNLGPARFVNCSFWGPTYQIAMLQGQSSVGFSDCIFCQWDGAAPALDVRRGSVMIRGCDFCPAQRQIFLAPEVQNAVISSNITGGKWQIANHAGGDVQIGLNAQR